MTDTILGVCILVIRLYILILVARIIIEMIRAYAQRYRAPRWFNAVAEMIFVATDPPVRLVRGVIPPLRVGGGSLDVSVLVLFFALNILIIVLQSF